MTTERKRWWRQVAALTVVGSVVAGGLFGIVRATAESQKAAPAVENAAWSRSSAPAVAEVERSSASSGIVQASGALPAVPPVVPVVPLIPTPPVSFPAGLEPPAVAPVGGDPNMLPLVPPLPAVDLPKLPSAPTIANPIVPQVPAPPARSP